MIRIGDVSTFKDVKADKEQVVKILEEAAEVFGAWQMDCEGYTHDEYDRCHHLKRECADVIQATCNLLAALGVNDFTGFIQDCKVDNEYRGRVYEDTVIKETHEPKEQMTLV